MAIQTYILSYDTGAEVDAILHKAEADYTRTEVDQAIAAAISQLPEPMVFQSGMTITADSQDPTKCSISVAEPASASDIKKGYTYKVIVISGTYTGTVRVGDTFIAQKDAPDMTISWVADTDWTVVPSGDETGYIVGKSSGTTQGHLMTWGANGFTAEDAGVEVETSITDSDAKIPTSKAVKTAMNRLDRVKVDSTETQDYYLQNSAPTNPADGDYWFDGSDLVASDIKAMTGYAKASAASAIGTGDTLNQAIGKLEKKADDNTSSLSGKQDAIDSTHKLSADLVDDSTTTNKFTNATEKETWNGKQDAINSSHKLSADLVDDSTTANKFTNATEKAKVARIIMDSFETTNVYIQSTQPTGTIPEGSIWFDTAVSGT